MRGERLLTGSREQVWNALHDPEVLRGAIPGCERLERVGPDSYDLTVHVGISAIRGTYAGSVRMSDEVRPDSYRLVARGEGRAGSAEGDVLIVLEDRGSSTLLRYEATLHAHGPLARLGGRLMGSAARMMADRFFDALEQELEARAAA